MFEITKQRIIKDLIDEIKCLSAVDLELVGHNAISILENRSMIHHGINKDYKPSGYTVDSFSEDSSIITEYSTEQDYYSDSSKKTDTKPFYEKINKDVNHALQHLAPNLPKSIILISSQDEPPSFRSNFNKTAIAQKFNSIIRIYDCRELAKLIYKQSIETNDAALYYKEFFPLFAQNFDNFEYFGKIPSFCDKHMKDPTSTDLISNHLKKNNIGVIFGISGSGKTQLAIDFIHSNKGEFENYIWLTGSDWKKDTSLASIKRTRGGAPINVVGLFNSYKTILVIDDLNRLIDEAEFEELKAGFFLGSRLIITSQLAKNSDNNYLSVPELSQNVLYKIIGEDENKISEKCKEVVSLCKSSPLILATIRNLVEEEGVDRDELYQEVIDNPTEVSGMDGKSIMSRILSKLDPILLEALRKISNSGSTMHDSAFLKEFIGVLKMNSLRRLSILLPAYVPGFLKIHDLVASSLQNNINSYELSHAIEKYLEKSNASMSPNIIRQIHLCSDMLQKEYDSYESIKLNWVTYALLQIESDNRSAIQEVLHNIVLKSDMELIAFRCLIDSKEAHAYTIENKEEKNKCFKECIKEYEEVLKQGLENDIKLEVLHHLGKTYRRCGFLKESLKCFQEILSTDSQMHASYLQIVHLGTQYNIDDAIKKEGESHLRKLMDFIFKDYTNVPLRVSLGSIAKLRSYRKVSDEISKNTNQIELIADIIALSSFEGFGQFFEAFVAFSSVFGYYHSSICLKLIENIPELLTSTPESIDKYNWLNACEGFTNLAIAASREGKGDLSMKIANASLPFANSFFDKKELSSFQGRALAKAYITADMPKKALLAVEKVPLNKHDHWLIYRKSEAELKSNSPNAYDTALEAYNLAQKDSKGLERIAIYHDLISQCAESIEKKEETLSHLKLAIDNCVDEKYREELESRLKKISRN